MVSRDHAARGVPQRTAGAADRKVRKTKFLRKTINKASSWIRRRVFWVEDHAKSVVTTLALLWLAGLGSAVLLLKWARFISLTIQLAATLTIVVVSVSAALAVFRWLKGRRSRRSAIGSADATGDGPEPGAAAL